MRHPRFLPFLAILGGAATACGASSDDVGSVESAAVAADTSRFSYEDLVALINDRGFTSIEQVLPALPEAFRSGYTLMNASGSLQDASDTNPRVIMFGADARLTCAFNGDPLQAGFDALECFQFRESERRFDFRQIRFPTSTNGLTQVAFSASGQSTDGTVQCSGCHRPDPRPNWEEYSTWPGAYGSEDDGLHDEAPRYAAFVARRSAHPRYRWLIQGTDPLAPYTMDGHADDVDVRPNVKFSDAVGRMNGFRATRILESRVPLWRSLALAVSYWGCALSQEQKDALARTGFDVAREVDFMRIFGSLGLARGDWGTNVHGDEYNAYDHEAGFTFLFNDVLLTIAQEQARAGNVELQQGFDKIRAFIATYYTGSRLRFFSTLDELVPDPTYHGDASPYLCPELARVFVAEALRR
jgi:hypothetical protein